jgi:hypothetical protein
MAMAKLPDFAKKYFWETDFNELDSEKNPEYIIGRILEYGDIEAARWMLEVFDRNLIRGLLSKKRGFSRVSANFWRIFFDLNEKDVLCLRKSYSKNQKTHWPY